MINEEIFEKIASDAFVDELDGILKNAGKIEDIKKAVGAKATALKGSYQAIPVALKEALKYVRNINVLKKGGKAGADKAWFRGQAAPAFKAAIRKAGPALAVSGGVLAGGGGLAAYLANKSKKD